MDFLLGKAGTFPVELVPRMLNRHGLIAGATGTGKTVTMQVIAEQLSRAGIPTLIPDVKGDLSGASVPGRPHKKIDERVEALGLTDYAFEGNPVTFWDVFGKNGVPLRTTVSELGPVLLSELLDLSDAQKDVLQMIFRIADDEKLLLLDLEDLVSITRFIGKNAEKYLEEYGLISQQSAASIQRKLIAFEAEGAELFLGEPALELKDLMKVKQGRGVINILRAKELMQRPKTYSMFLLWLLSELFEQLPEVGNPDKPKLVFFFDEAHLLFKDTPKALQEKIEQVVRLIRSKGVGVFFVTQNPIDLPEDVLGQLGNRVQHALRAYTPKDRKAIRAAAQNFASNPEVDVEKAITSMGVGVALISILDEKGRPQPVQETLISPPRSRIGPIEASEVQKRITNDPLFDKYGKEIDRESAHEMLARSVKKKTPKETKKKSPSKFKKQLSNDMKKELRSAGRTLGRELVRGILGSFLKR